MVVLTILRLSATVIRWITVDNNYRARSSYDNFATKTQWLTCEIKP